MFPTDRSTMEIVLHVKEARFKPALFVFPAEELLVEKWAFAIDVMEINEQMLPCIMSSTLVGKIEKALKGSLKKKSP